MKTLKQQQGTTFISWLVIIAVILFFVYLGMKLTPIYLENFNVKKVMASLENDPGFTFTKYSPLTKSKIKKTLYKRFTVNGIDRSLIDKIKVSSHDGGVEVSLAYETRENFLSNIDIVVNFKDDVVVTRQ